MANTALNRTGQLLLTNKSGGAVAQGDVVIIDTANAASFTTTTTSGYVSGTPGVVLEPNGIANNALGMVAVQGYVPVINLSGTGSIGDLIKTHTVAKQGVRNAAPAVAGNFAQALGTSATPVALLWGSANLSAGAGSDPAKIPLAGWIADANTWSYSSVDGPTGVISVNADMTTVIGVGMRIKITQTSVKYFIVTAVGAFGGGATLITVYGGTDYTLANAGITSPNYSPVKAPLGFPLDPAKWTVSVSDTSLRTQATPTNGTWYNLGTVTISIPIGIWFVTYQCSVQSGRSVAQSMPVWSTLSTANNSESDTTMTCYGVAAAVTANAQTFHRSRLLTLAAKTAYYLNEKVDTINIDNLFLRSDNTPTLVMAVCALL